MSSACLLREAPFSKASSVVWSLLSWLQGVCLLRVPALLLHNCIPETCNLILLLSHDFLLLHLFFHLCIIRHLLIDQYFSKSHLLQKDACREPPGIDSRSVSDYSIYFVIALPITNTNAYYFSEYLTMH